MEGFPCVLRGFMQNMASKNKKSEGFILAFTIKVTLDTGNTYGARIEAVGYGDCFA